MTVEEDEEEVEEGEEDAQADETVGYYLFEEEGVSGGTGGCRVGHCWVDLLEFYDKEMQ